MLPIILPLFHIKELASCLRYFDIILVQSVVQTDEAISINRFGYITIISLKGDIADMMQTLGLDMSETVDPDDIDASFTDAAWAICATHHTVLQLLPGTAIFGWDIYFIRHSLHS